MKRVLVTILIFISALCTVRAEQADTLINYNVTELVVTATRTPLPLKDTPVITRVLTGDQIRRQGLVSIEEVLQRELAGVEFHQAGYGTTMSFQGLDARYVLFLVDGERIAGETYGNIDYQRIPVANIERIEIIRGASSVLYGSSAMGSVVNIITAMPKRKFEISGSARIGTRFQGNSDETLGSGADQGQTDKYRDRLDLPNFNGNLSVGFNTGKLRSLTTGRFRTTDAYKLRGTADQTRHYGTLTRMRPNIVSAGGPPSLEFGPGGIPVFVPAGTNSDTTINVPPDQRGLGVSGSKEWAFGQKFNYTVSEKFRFELSGNFYRRERYDFHTSVMDDNPVSGYFPGSGAWNWESYKGYDTRFMMEHSPNDRNKIYLTFMRDDYFRSERQWGKIHTPKQRHTYNIPRLLWTTQIGKFHKITSGIEFTNERLRFDITEESDGYNRVRQINMASAYVQDEIMSGRKLSFTAGLRGDWSSDFGWRATPQASAKYSFGNFSLRANYSMGYRVPTLKEMYMVLDIPVAGSPRIEGNPGLKAESNHYVSLSLDYNLEWLNLSAAIGQSFFRDKIDVRRQFSNEQGRQFMRYENIDKSKLGTIELIGRVRMARSLFLTANYNYIYQSDNAPEGSTQYIFPSRHTASMSVDYAFALKRTRVALNFNVRYVGPKDYEDFMPYIVIPDALLNYIAMEEPRPPMMTQPGMMEAIGDFKYFTGSYKSRHKGYAVCNASVDVRFPFGISVTAGVDNMFDYQPKVVDFNSALLAGANGFLRISFAF